MAPGSAKKSVFKLRYFELGFGPPPSGRSSKNADPSKDVEYLHYYDLTPTLKYVYELGMNAGSPTKSGSHERSSKGKSKGACELVFNM